MSGCFALEALEAQRWVFGGWEGGFVCLVREWFVGLGGLWWTFCSFWWLVVGWQAVFTALFNMMHHKYTF